LDVFGSGQLAGIQIQSLGCTLMDNPHQKNNL